jgi:hypothetical protein
LPAIESHPEESVSDFPVNFIINTLPHKGVAMKRPAETDVVNYGKYMTTASGCMECHTQANDKGELLAGLEYGGGRAFPFPDGSVVRAGNISSDNETGIGNWSEEQFLSLFRSRSDSAALQTTVKPGEFQTVMPWTMYGNMTETDLKSILAYLKTVKPINNSVEKYTAAK